MGIVRAMIRNIESGEFSQGASTITQQVARSFLLTREKKISRKVKEAILAYRIEKNFSKEYILYLYLNQIFLGHGAYGVEAASQLYFDKHVEDLDLAEAAIIAGLPQAPSRYSPNNSYSSAKARQRYTLDQMVDVGFISQAEADVAYDGKLVFVHKRDKNLDVGPYFVEHVRRYLVDQYGHDAVYLDGMTVYTTMDPELQLAANKAVQWGVREVDHRVGRYEPFGLLEGGAVKAELAAIDLERYLATLPYDPSREEPTVVPSGAVPPLVEGELTRGVVAEVKDQYVWVDVGSIRGILHHADGKWAYKPDPDASVKWRQIAKMGDSYNVGNVITVRVMNPDETWRKTLGNDDVYPRLALDQEPQVEGALYSMRLSDGAVLAMVGGYDYLKSEFNRATQAKRQVGSTFKPLVYASALDCNRHADTQNCGAEDKDITYTPSTIIVESPIVGFKPTRGGGVEAWKPGNADGDFMGDMTLRRALVLSRNIVTLKIAQSVGVNYLYEYIERFGFDTEQEPNLALALGSGCLSIEEMVRAYSVFATVGNRQSPYSIRQVLDRDGRVLEETTAGVLVEDVLDEVTAYQMVRLMRDVVSSGTATKALVLGVPLQGKTGTTNDYKDAWFMGYNAQIVTGVWIGFDDFNRSLGRQQYGGDCALPIWIDYMRTALQKYPETSFTRPPGVEIVEVDSKTGLLVGEGRGGIQVAFRANTAPTSYAQAEGEVDSSEFLTSDGGL
jgi:penicillin-binding protein 1A